jgi:hypothetical protein
MQLLDGLTAGDDAIAVDGVFIHAGIAQVPLESSSKVCSNTISAFGATRRAQRIASSDDGEKSTGTSKLR